MRPLVPATSPAAREAAFRAKLALLATEAAQLELALHGEDPDEIIRRHIALLHKYNERKDATQVLIGKLASIERVSVAEASAKLGITETD